MTGKQKLLIQDVADNWEAEATMLFDNNAVIDKRVEISYCCDSFLRIL